MSQFRIEPSVSLFDLNKVRPGPVGKERARAAKYESHDPVRRISKRRLWGGGTQGKKFRSDFAKALLTANLSDSIVQCNEGRFGNPGYNKMPHDVMLRYLARSLYCPVLPGDDQSSQHLTERYLAGCIPVFLGPPYHAMPFEQEVDYGASAVFINVSDSAAWLGDIRMSWSYPYIPEVGPPLPRDSLSLGPPSPWVPECGTQMRSGWATSGCSGPTLTSPSVGPPSPWLPLPRVPECGLLAINRWRALTLASSK